MSLFIHLYLSLIIQPYSVPKLQRPAMACVCNALITSALPYKLVASPPEKWGTGDALLLPELVYVFDLQGVRLKPLHHPCRQSHHTI